MILVKRDQSSSLIVRKCGLVQFYRLGDTKGCLDLVRFFRFADPFGGIGSVARHGQHLPSLESG